MFLGHIVGKISRYFWIIQVRKHTNLKIPFVFRSLRITYLFYYLIHDILHKCMLIKTIFLKLCIETIDALQIFYINFCLSLGFLKKSVYVQRNPLLLYIIYNIDLFDQLNI